MTPCDHVGDSERVSPCSARCSPRSVGRVTSSSPSVLLDVDVARDALGELALGAVDAHALGLDRRRSRRGHGDGLLADAGHAGYQTSATTSPPTPARAGVVAGHHAAGGGDDRRAHAAQHLRDVLRVDVGAPAGARDALQAGDRRLAVLGVLQATAICSPARSGSGGCDLEALDVALLREDARELALELSRPGCRRSLVRAATPLRIRVRKSAMGSVIDIVGVYQLDFVMPGM